MCVTQHGHAAPLKPSGLYGQRQEAKWQHDCQKGLEPSLRRKEQDEPLPVPREEELAQGEKLSLFGMPKSTQLQAQSLLGVPVSSPAQPSSGESC